VSNPNIQVEVTDMREIHCFRLVLNAAASADDPERRPIEIMLRATDLVDLIHKCSEALCDWQAQTSRYLLDRYRQVLTNDDRAPANAQPSPSTTGGQD
jgi:hypothetical protein